MGCRIRCVRPHHKPLKFLCIQNRIFTGDKPQGREGGADNWVLVKLRTCAPQGSEREVKYPLPRSKYGLSRNLFGGRQSIF